jgi:hypothetical protein
MGEKTSDGLAGLFCEDAQGLVELELLDVEPETCGSRHRVGWRYWHSYRRCAVAMQASRMTDVIVTDLDLATHRAPP